MGFAVASVPRPPTSTGPTAPSPFSPWHLEQRAAKTSRPAATVPEPSGRPVPSGAIATPRSRICAGAGGRPTPYLGDWAASATAPANSIALSFHIGHRPVGLH